MPNKKFIARLKMCGFNNAQARTFLNVTPKLLRDWREGELPVPRTIMEALEAKAAKTEAYGTVQEIERELMKIRNEKRNLDYQVEKLSLLWLDYMENQGEADKLDKLDQHIEGMTNE